MGFKATLQSSVRGQRAVDAYVDTDHFVPLIELVNVF